MAYRLQSLMCRQHASGACHAPPRFSEIICHCRCRSCSPLCHHPLRRGAKPQPPHTPPLPRREAPRGRGRERAGWANSDATSRTRSVTAAHTRTSTGGSRFHAPALSRPLPLASRGRGGISLSPPLRAQFRTLTKLYPICARMSRQNMNIYRPAPTSRSSATLSTASSRPASRSPPAASRGVFSSPQIASQAATRSG